MDVVAYYPQDTRVGIGMAQSRYRRAFCTIHVAHCENDIIEAAKRSDTQTAMQMKFERIRNVAGHKVIRAMAMALEVCPNTGRTHIQGYVELTGGRPWSWYGKVFKTMATCWQTVKDGPGSWAYCTGTGTHSGKPALARYASGEPLLHGGSESQANLRKLVELLVEGVHPQQILQRFPYAYTVHRRKIWDLYGDLIQLERDGLVQGPVYGFTAIEEN